MRLTSAVSSLPILLLAASSSVSAATYATVKADLKSIVSAAKGLNKAVQATDGSSLVAAYGIKDQAQAFVSQLDSSTSDVNSLSKTVTKSQASTLIDIMKGTTTTAKAACQKLSSDRDRYNASGAGGPIRAVVYKISDSSSKFTKALLSKTPSSKKATAQKLVDDFNKSIAVCTKAFPA